VSVYDPGMFGGRARKSGVVEAMAECGTCNWKAESRNAVGLAAQHCDRTGHIVSCHQIIVTTYGPTGTPPEALVLGSQGD
jgi:hypothetical protein